MLVVECLLIRLNMSLISMAKRLVASVAESIFIAPKIKNIGEPCLTKFNEKNIVYFSFFCLDFGWTLFLYQ